ncbi:MAG: ribonuclease III [Firmicutes bacterium]|nr:ribonuclease III [Bacillota bacterium]
MSSLENRLNYTFKDKTLLETALTHSSYSKSITGDMPYNERLEFLGDAFFDAIIGEALFEAFPKEEEGFLSRIRATIVCETSLARHAMDLELGQYIRIGKGEEKTGGRERPSILADAMEAIMGAIYLDGGFEEVKKVVLTLFEDTLKDARNGKYIITDYKTALQEWLQSKGINQIKYVLTGEEGPDHNKTFFVSLEVQGKVLTDGSGKSKKQAEQKAAELALRRYDVI